jgi:hypothetical protein
MFTETGVLKNRIKLVCNKQAFTIPDEYMYNVNFNRNILKQKKVSNKWKILDFIPKKGYGIQSSTQEKML